MNTVILTLSAITDPTITVPTWIITLLVPLFVTILIAVITNIKVVAKQNGKFETCIDGINTRLSDVNNRIDRIETKIDSFILKNIL